MPSPSSAPTTPFDPVNRSTTDPAVFTHSAATSSRPAPARAETLAAPSSPRSPLWRRPMDGLVGWFRASDLHSYEQLWRELERGEGTSKYYTAQDVAKLRIRLQEKKIRDLCLALKLPEETIYELYPALRPTERSQRASDQARAHNRLKLARAKLSALRQALGPEYKRPRDVDVQEDELLPLDRDAPEYQNKGPSWYRR
ncbi:hypothetical protein JCM3770_005755 [Rhodotorula araucariae]